MTVLRDDAGIAEGAGTGGAFRVDGVPLVPDGNVLQARGEDAAGNRSVALERDRPHLQRRRPAPSPTSRRRSTARTVSLQWAPVGRRRPRRLRRPPRRRSGSPQTVPQDEAAAIEATSRYWAAPLGLRRRTRPPRGCPESPGTGTWTVTFPRPSSSSSVRLRFAPAGGIEPGHPARLHGPRPVAGPRPADRPRARQHAARGRAPAARALPDDRAARRRSSPRAASPRSRSSGSTSCRRAPSRSRTRASPTAATPTRSPRSTATAPRARRARSRPRSATSTRRAGPPASWRRRSCATCSSPGTPSPEPDVAHYVVLRDGSRIGTSPTPSYLDPGRPNGTYRYTVIAVDEAGHESERVRPGRRHDRRPAGAAGRAGHPRAHRRRAPDHPRRLAHRRGRPRRRRHLRGPGGRRRAAGDRPRRARLPAARRTWSSPPATTSRSRRTEGGRPGARVAGRDLRAGPRQRRGPARSPRGLRAGPSGSSSRRTGARWP